MTVPLYKDKIQIIQFKNTVNRRSFPLIMTLYNNYNKCITRTLHTVENERQNFFIFIQLDQQIYRPADEVRFRIIVIGRDIKAYHMNTINVKIIDPSGKNIKIFDDVEDMYLGVFNKSFQLSCNSTIGNWKIKVIVDKNDQHEALKTFIVINNPESLISNSTIENSELSIQNSLKVGDTVELNIQSRFRLDKVIGLVMSMNGIVDSYVNSCGFKFDCNFSIPVKNNMKPESKADNSV